MATVKNAEPVGLPRFRHAEQAVWDHYDLRPREKLVSLSPSRVVRLHVAGAGTPILFVHGSGGSGAYWAPLVKELASDYRCILIDRPGWTLSTPTDHAAADFGSMAADLLGETLDALELETAHLVGGSIGDLYALRFAQRHPDRATSVVLLGGGPLTPEVRPPTFVRLLRSPIGRIMIRMPQRPGMVRKQMEGLGHKTSFHQGLIPDELVDLYVATSRHTAAMQHERELVKSIVDRDGFVDGLTITDAELRDFRVQTTMIYGSDDPVGDRELWQEFVQEMPNGAFHEVGNAGHLPWYDQPRQVANVMRDRLKQAER